MHELSEKENVPDEVTWQEVEKKRQEYLQSRRDHEYPIWLDKYIDYCLASSRLEKTETPRNYRHLKQEPVLLTEKDYGV